MKPFRVLGLHTAGHDAGACIFEDGALVSTIETERLTRTKHDHRVAPALEFVLRAAKLQASDIDMVAVGTTVNQEFLQVENLPAALTAISSGMLSVATHCQLLGERRPCQVVVHEACHAAIAAHYLPDINSPTLVLTNEGRGSLARSSVFVHRAQSLELLDTAVLPWYACGFGWSAIGYALGFGKGPSVAGTVMALGGYGQYSERIHRSLLDVDSDIMQRTRAEQEVLLRDFLASQWADSSFDAKADLVATLQRVFTQTVRACVRAHAAHAGVQQLALSGGCALNVVSNSELRASFPGCVTIPPTPNDAGIALGAAVYVMRYVLGMQPKPVSVYANGEAPTSAEAHATFKQNGLTPSSFDLERVAQALANGQVVAFCQGKGELGPRALGNRSLLGNAAEPGMRHLMSEQLKRREWFRPLAPVMREERFAELFTGQPTSPYMLFSYDAGHAGIPEAAHIDGTARVQTVQRASHPMLWELLARFEALTGVPALINTSLNGKDRAIAQTCSDVLSDFGTSEVDMFVVGDVMSENRERSVRRRSRSRAKPVEMSSLRTQR